MSELHFLIDAEGNIQVLDILGKGKECTGVSQSIEQRIGKAVESSREFTAEYGGDEEVDVETTNG